MKKILFSVTALCCTLFSVNAQNVNIPDANFKAYLVGNSSINTNSDTEIQVTEAQSFAGTIDCSNQSISDLTGIEEFTALTILFCEDNLLDSIDISSNTALIRLFCDNNQLDSLNVSYNTVLEDLGCSNNQLSTLDITNNTSLKWLDCSDNLLSSLSLVNITALTYLNCNHNQITSLNVSNQASLVELQCTYNQLSALDVSNNGSLSQLWFIENQIATIDLSNNTALSVLRCLNNDLTSLDLSNNAALYILACQNNQLTSLNVANGNNTFFTGFFATNNPGLTCIQVDDAAYSASNWTNIDTSASFSEDCSVGVDEADAIVTNFYPNPMRTHLNIELKEAATLHIVNLLGETVLTQPTTMGINTVNVSHLTAGVYFLQVGNQGAIKVLKQ